MKPLLKRLHFYLATVSCFFILSMSASGMLLVFAKEIQETLNPKQNLIELPSQTLDIAAIVTTLYQQHNLVHNPITRIQIPTKQTRAWRISLTNGQQLAINPNTAHVLHSYKRGDDFYHTIESWHRWLLVNNKTLRPWVRHLISTVALILILQVIIGYILWWNPRKKTLAQLTMLFKPSRQSTRRFIFQLHSVLGILFGIVLILIAFTGTGFNWSASKALYELTTASRMTTITPPQYVHYGGVSQLKVSINNGLSVFPGAKLYRIQFPKTSTDPLQLRVQQKNESYPFSTIWLEGGTGDVIAVYDALAASRASRLWQFKYLFHTGAFGGLLTRILWIIIALLPIFFTLSGLWLYWCRKTRLNR